MLSRMPKTKSIAFQAALKRLGLAAIITLSLIGGAIAQAPRQCEEMKNHETKLKRASDALSRTLGADATARGTVAGDAALASAEALAAFIVFENNIAISNAAGPAGPGMGMAMEVQCQALHNSFGDPTQSECLLRVYADSSKRAGEKLEALKRSNPPTQVRDAAEEMQSALRSAASAAPGCIEALKSAQNSPAGSGGSGGPQLTGGLSGPHNLGVGGQPNSFDSDVLNFHVKLESGVTDRMGQNLGLRGVVSLWPKNNPSLKLTLRDAAVTIKSAGSGFNSVGGAGKLELSVGGQTLTFPDASFDSTPDGNTLNGTGKFQRFNHTFDISYAVSGQNFTGQGEWQGRERGWQPVPGFDGVEFKIDSPRLKISFTNSNVSGNTYLTHSQKHARLRNGAEAAGASEEIAVSNDGKIQLSLPPLPQPEDLNRKAREACEETARNLRQDTKPCRTQFPGPPPLPSLPSRIEIPLSAIIE